MSPEEEAIIFDASSYPGFERARILSKRRGIPADRRIRGYGTAIIIVVVMAMMLLSPDSRNRLMEQPLLFVLVFASLGFLVAGILFVLLTDRASSGIPVKLTESGLLLLGDRSWNVRSIRQLAIFGGFGAVEGKDEMNHSMFIIDRPQFGSLDDFLEVFKRMNPGVEVRREGAPVKVRLAKES